MNKTQKAKMLAEEERRTQPGILSALGAVGMLLGLSGALGLFIYALIFGMGLMPHNV